MSESCPGVVLIVDGDASNVSDLRAGLGAAGYVVLDASDAGSALNHLNSHHVDVVVTELKLTGGDGLQLLENIRRACPDTRVIVATGHGTIETAVEAMKRGSADFLTRPLSGTLLVQKIREACAGRSNGREALATASARRDQVATMDQLGGFTMSAPSHVDGAGGLTEMIEGLERSLIEGALQRAAGNQAKAAQFLRIPRTTLRDKMAKYGMVGEAGRRQVTT